VRTGPDRAGEEGNLPVFSDRIDAGGYRDRRGAGKHIGLRFSDHDIYVNVAGGILFYQTGIDLPLAWFVFARTGLGFPAGRP
jgi:DNA repair protein RadA/Sms